MRTFLILLGGWLAGGLIVMALAAPQRARVQSETVPPIVAAAPVHAITMPQAALVIPVIGITREQLRDTFFEMRGGGNRTHRAMDILAPQGTPVVAAVDGKIRKLFNSRAGGLTIYQFDQREEKVYYYAHLDRYADGVAEGRFVRQGTVIGYVGVTGNAGSTPHLHFSIETLPPTKEWWKGEPLNPYPLLTSFGVTLTTPASAPR